MHPNSFTEITITIEKLSQSIVYSNTFPAPKYSYALIFLNKREKALHSKAVAMLHSEHKVYTLIRKKTLTPSLNIIHYNNLVDLL